MKTLKYAWRFLIRSKSYTIINLLGLAFSLACCIILLRYIHRELTVDTHCIDREQVYGFERRISAEAVGANKRMQKALAQKAEDDKIKGQTYRGGLSA